MSQKKIFVLFILLTILPLIYYRYFLTLTSVSNLTLSADYYFGLGFNGFENLIVPLGLSYQTYQALGYLIDVYMQRAEPTKNIVECSLFLSFFPQLPLGPISKYSELSVQFKKDRIFDYSLAVDGVALVVFGAAKKIIISEELNPLYRELFSYKYDLKSTLVVCFLTPIFLYFDFSSFIDIARGISKIFGINLTQNFQSPLTQKSVGAFWSKWHMSLFRWLRDYIFYPLLGVSKNKYMVYLWILIIFIMSGVWHGLESKFAIVGTIAGLFYIFEKTIGVMIEKHTKKIPQLIANMVKHIYTYFAITVITFNYISPSISYNFSLAKFLLENGNNGLSLFPAGNKALVSIIVAFIFIFLESKIKFFQTQIWSRNFKTRWFLIMALSLLTLTFYKTNLRPFIYFFS